MNTTIKSINGVKYILDKNLKYSHKDYTGLTYKYTGEVTVGSETYSNFIDNEGDQHFLDADKLMVI